MKSFGPSFHRWAPPAANFVALIALIGLLVQIERGTGSIGRSLMFVAFDLGLLGGLAILVRVLTGRRYVPVLVSLGIVFVTWYCGYLRTQYTGLPMLADDIALVFSAWDVVQEYVWPVGIATGVAIALCAVALRLEKRTPMTPMRQAAAVAVGIALLGGCVRVAGQIPTDDPLAVTGVRGGRLALFYRSLFSAPDFGDTRFPALGDYCCFRDRKPATLSFEGAVKPHIVVVLQESTFDPANLRHMQPTANFLLEGSAPLAVHVAGAGTWVEEYSVMHGVAPTAYGSDYSQILSEGLREGLQGRLPTLLKAQGYATTSLLPIDGRRLNGEDTHRSLGFETVLDCPQIRGCRPGAQWNLSTDAVFYDAATELLRNAQAPQLVYLATVRQHSPHIARYPASAHTEELKAEYLRRFDLSGREASQFIAGLRSIDRPTIVLMFGDHIPSDIRAAYGDEDFVKGPRRTFFNVWDTDGQPIGAKLMSSWNAIDAVDSAFLDAIVLRHAGFRGEYLDLKLEMMAQCAGSFCRGDGTRLASRRR